MSEKITNELKRLSFINRQPTLWKHGCPAVELLPTDDDDDCSIRLSPLILEPMNADFDGDTMAIYGIHDVGSLKEIEVKAFLQNVIYYDQQDSYLAKIRHEALFAAYVLTNININFDDIICEIKNLNDLPENLDLWNNKLNGCVILNDEKFSYGISLFNKFCGFNRIIINKCVAKKQADEVSEAIYFFNNKNNKKYYDNLTELEKKLFTFISVTKHIPSLNINEMSGLKDKHSAKLLQNLPNKNILLGYALADAIADRCIDNLDENCTLSKLFTSGSRFSKAQLVRSCIAVSFSADAENNVMPDPIKSSLLEGLTEEQYFMVSPGTRKSIADKSKSTPDSGYLERTLTMAMAMIELDLEDCGTEYFIDPVISSRSHAMSIVGKYYRDPLNSDKEWKVLDKETAITFINKKIELRSPMTCLNPNFNVCKKCFGEKILSSKYVGIIAGQNITERLTQLTMRTFHESGRAVLNIDSTIISFFTKHLTNIEKALDDKKKEFIKLSFNTNQFPESLISKNSIIKGLLDINTANNYLIYGEDNNIIPNNDVVSIINQIKILLRQGNTFQLPIKYYIDMMTLLMDVGIVYSSYIELLFANMFITNYEHKEFWRYNQNKQAVFKLGDKMMAAYISPIIGLLYQPNKNTIEKIDLDFDYFDEDNMTIYEKIWLNKL